MQGYIYELSDSSDKLEGEIYSFNNWFYTAQTFGSTDHIELKDNLGSDDPEGDIPVLLQAVLARSPNVFREKSMQNRYVQSGMMMSQYKLSQNSMHSSPASSNYQQTTISHSPSSRFVPPQTSSGNKFMPQQNSPVATPAGPGADKEMAAGPAER